MQPLSQASQSLAEQEVLLVTGLAFSVWYQKLTHAIWVDNLEVVKDLVPVSLALVRQGYGPPWELALAYQRIDIIEYLASLEAKIYPSDVRQCVQYGNVVTLRAVLHHHIYDVLGIFEENSILYRTDKHHVSLGVEILLYAIKDSNLDVLTTYLPLLPNINMVLLHTLDIAENFSDTDGSTLLHVAASCSKLEIVSELLRAGINVCQLNKRKRTALHAAACGGRREVAALLITNGLSVHTRDYKGWTALDMALYQYNVPVIEVLLLDHGCRPSIPVPPHCSKLLRQAFLDGNGDLCAELRAIGVRFEDPSFESAFQGLQSLSTVSLLDSLEPSANALMKQMSLTQPAALTQTGYESPIELSRYWLTRCYSKHGLCSLANPEVPVLPRRVLRVHKGSSRCSLIETNEHRAYYFALSHRRKTDHMYTTTLANYEEHKHSIDTTRLSPSIQLAIDLTRVLGVEYLWVDALCMLQDSDSDKDEDIENMADIYSKSCLTIAIIDSDASKKDYRSVADGESHNTKRPRGVLDTRAWVLQEQILSRRILSFTTTAAYWDCLACSSSPMYRTGIPVHLDRGYEERDLRILKEAIHLGRLLTVNAPIERYLRNSWHRLVEDYSRRGLTYIEDRAAALTGIVTRISRIIRDEYVVGLWRGRIAIGLCWCRQTNKEIVPQRITAMRPFSSPSWSWLSVNFPISYRDTISSTAFTRQFKDPLVDLVYPSASALTIHGINHVRLRLRGTLRDAPSELEHAQKSYLESSKGLARGWIAKPFDHRCSYDSDERPSSEGQTFWCEGMSLSLIIEPVVTDRHSELSQVESGKNIVVYRRIGVFFGRPSRPFGPLDVAKTKHDGLEIIDLE